MLAEQGEGARADPGHGAGADRRADRPAAAGLALGHPARRAGRARLLARRGRTLDPELDVETALAGLVERQLLSREPISTISGEVAYRFRHVLIRDVAYSGLAKGVARASTARSPDWLRGARRDELVEAQAFHLDRAAASLAELDGRVPDDLRAEAAAALERAGRRALVREANRTARRLLLRSIELEPSLDRRFYAARAAWRLWELPAAPSRWRPCATWQPGGRRPDDRGLALVQLAEIVLNRNADVEQARRLGERGARAARRRAGRRALRGAHAPRAASAGGRAT